jgi:integrase
MKTIKEKKKSQRDDGRFVVTKVFNGKKKYFYSPISKKYAEKQRDEYEESLKSKPKNYKDITLSEWLDEWLINVKQDNISDKAFQSYESNCRVHIKPYLGGQKLSDLEIPLIRSFLTYCKNKVVCRMKKPTEEDLKNAKKISARTLQYIYVTLNAALEQARKDKIILENPCDTVEKPTVKPSPIKIFTDKEKIKLLNMAQKTDIEMHTMIVLALDTGARLSEFLNLKWSKVDLQTGRIVIDQATEQTKDEGAKEASTKNAASIRAIKLTQECLDILDKYKEIQDSQIKEYGTHYIDNDYVFAKKDGLLIPNYEISKRFKKIALAAGLRSDAHFHETRHTLATELIEMGVNQFKVQALLGHATLDMTKRYTHLNVDSQDEIINKLNKKRSRSKKS